MPTFAKPDSEIVREVLAPRISRCHDLTSAGVAINAQREFDEISNEDTPAILEQSSESKSTEQAELGQEIAKLGRSLGSIQVPTYEEYRDGAPLITSIDPNSNSKQPKDLVDHVRQNGNKLRTINEAAPQDAKQAGLAFAIGLFFGLIAFLAVVFPFFTNGFGSDALTGTWDAKLIWNVVTTIGGALTMVAAGGALVFLRGNFSQSMRTAGWLVTVAMVLLAARYIAVHFQADPDAEGSLSQHARNAMYWIASTGIGIATYLVEFAAGCCFAFFWRDRECRKHLPYARQLLADIAAWDAARTKLAPTFTPILNRSAVIQECVARIAATIDKGVFKHQTLIAECESLVSVPPTGATSESYDLPALKARIAACLKARDQLIALAAKPRSRPPSSIVQTDAQLNLEL